MDENHRHKVESQTRRVPVCDSVDTKFKTNQHKPRDQGIASFWLGGTAGVDWTRGGGLGASRGLEMPSGWYHLAADRTDVYRCESSLTVDAFYYLQIIPKRNKGKKNPAVVIITEKSPQGPFAVIWEKV